MRWPRPTAAVLSISVLVALAACAGKSGLEGLEMGQTTVVDRSADERPDWMTNPPETEDGLHYFSGGETGVRDLDNSFRQARAEAWQTLGESLLGTFSSLFQEVEISGDQSLQEYARNFQELAVNQLRLMGVETEERYYERRARRTPTGIEYSYNSFVLLSIPQREWRAAQIRALQRLKGQVSGPGSEQARKWIDDAIQRLEQLRQGAGGEGGG